MAKLVSKTYGDALFELALEENKIDSLQEEVEVVLVALAENQDLTKLMNHPKISKDEKVTLIDTVKAPFAEEMLARVASVIDPAKVDYIISNHSEPDHSGGLPAVIAATAPEKIFASVAGTRSSQDRRLDFARQKHPHFCGNQDAALARQHGKFLRPGQHSLFSGCVRHAPCRLPHVGG